MTREEEIREALNLYAPSSWDFRGEIVPMSKGELQASHEGFVRGAKWADANPKQGLVDLSQVWHDASEIPNEDSLIILQGIYGDILLLRFANRSSSMTTIQKWAYIEDLLPKEASYDVFR